MGNMELSLELAAPCGLFCPACAIFIATKNNDLDRLAIQAEQLGQTIENTKCYGCRSSKRSAACSNCKMYDCTTAQNIHFCVECEKFPCAHLLNWQTLMQHRLELWKDFETIKQKGYKQWMKEAYVNYECSKCKTINSAFDESCNTCGATPSCNYVKNNAEAIKLFL